MRTPGFLRALTPWGWVIVVAMLLLAVTVTVIGRGIGLRWDPFDLNHRRLTAAREHVKVLDQDLKARRLEVAGAQAQARRVASYHQTLTTLAVVTARTLERTSSDDDAQMPLEADRAGRLRDHDRELCRLAPAVCDTAAIDLTG